MRLFSNLIAAILAGLIVSIWVGPATAQGASYQDPQGRFSVGLVGDWTAVEKAKGVVWYDYDDLPISMTFMAVENPNLATAFSIALNEAGIDPGTLAETGRTNWNKWSLSSYSRGEGQGVTLLGQVRDQTSYLILAIGAEELTHNPPEDAMASIQSFSFAGDDVLPETVAAFEAYATQAVGVRPPGLSIVIATPQDVIYQRGFGLADGPRGIATTPQTVFHWGSVTKTVTATAIMQLREQGLLDLDAPIATYLDYVPADLPITARHLLTHSSGLPEAADFVLRHLRLKGEPLPDFDLVTRVVFTGLDELMFAPGTKSVYANPNYLILGQIVAALSEQEYVDYVRDHIFKPLGLINTDFVYATETMSETAAFGAIPADQMAAIASLVDQAKGSGIGETYFREIKDDMAWFQHFIVGEAAGGGLMGPATEMVRFGQMMLNNGTLNGARILSPGSVALLQEVQTLESGEPLGIGLSWFSGGDEAHPFIEHDGGGPGLQAKLRLYMKDGLAVAIMANGAGVERDYMADAAANVVFNMSAR